MWIFRDFGKKWQGFRAMDHCQRTLNFDLLKESLSPINFKLHGNLLHQTYKKKSLFSWKCRVTARGSELYKRTMRTPWVGLHERIMWFAPSEDFPRGRHGSVSEEADHLCIACSCCINALRDKFSPICLGTIPLVAFFF